MKISLKKTLKTALVLTLFATAFAGRANAAVISLPTCPAPDDAGFESNCHYLDDMTQGSGLRKHKCYDCSNLKNQSHHTIAVEGKLFIRLPNFSAFAAVGGAYIGIDNFNDNLDAINNWIDRTQQGIDHVTSFDDLATKFQAESVMCCYRQEFITAACIPIDAKGNPVKGATGKSCSEWVQCPDGHIVNMDEDYAAQQPLGLAEGYPGMLHHECRDANGGNACGVA